MRWLRWPLLLLYVLLLLEIGGRAFWRVEYGVPLWGATPRDWYGIFFEGFRRSAQVPPGPQPETLDVLLLGGSTLFHVARAARGELLRDGLASATGRPVRIVNHAKRAHTTRDSLLKYRLLEGEPFDLVVIYHGINDARLNNAPPERFRADYSHAAWYDKLNLLARSRPWEATALLPFGLAYAQMDLGEAQVFGRYVPRNRPMASWTRFGGEIRTEATFRSNLTEILSLAAQRGQPVLLMTFAWYVPEGYTLERFERRELDYDEHKHAIEIWGEPAHVTRALEAHNRVIRELAASRDVLFVDAAAELAPGRETFDDICHLTWAGESRFVERLAAAVGPVFAAR
jgi:lysophospholipase L1-like esterase